MSISSTVEIVTLLPADGVKVTVNKEWLKMSKMLGDMIEDFGTEIDIPLPGTTSAVLTEIIKYLEKEHCKPIIEGAAKDLISEDTKILLEANKGPTLYKMLVQANYLNITKLIDDIIPVFVDPIRGKKRDEILKYYDIELDWTKEEWEIARGTENITEDDIKKALAECKEAETGEVKKP